MNSNMTFDKVRDLLYCGLDDLSKSNTLDRQSIELIGEIVDALKDMDEIEMNSSSMETGEQSYNNNRSFGYAPNYNGGNSYGRGVMGNRRMYGRGGYSYDDGRQDFVRQLEDVMHQMSNDQDRRAVENLLNQMR